MLDSRKKFFLSFVSLLGVLIASHFFFHDHRINNNHSHSQSPEFIRSSFSRLKERDATLPVVGIYPISVEHSNHNPLAVGIQDIWTFWLSQSPSLVIADDPFLDRENLIPSFSSYYLKPIARRMGVDYLYSAHIFSGDGKVFLQPLVYDSRENTVLKTKLLEVHEELLSHILNQSINQIIGLTERSLSHGGKDYSIDRGLYFQELYMPATDSLARYFHFLKRMNSSSEPSYAEWEELAKRENLFWNPYERYIRSRFIGKEDSYDAKYYIESLASKSTSYFQGNLAVIASQFGKTLLDKQDRYKTMGLLQLADNLFKSSQTTLSLSYAKNLSYMGAFYANEKNWENARLYLLNSQAILDRLNGFRHPVYLQNKFLLAKVYRNNRQIHLGTLELEEAIAIAHEEWNFNKEDYFFYLALSYYNLGTMYLESDRPSEAYKKFLKSESLLRKKPLIYSELMFYSVVNRGASLILQGKWNEFISLGLDLNKDIRIIGLEGSTYDSKNSYNLSLAYQSKGALETSRDFGTYYRKITSYSQLKSMDKGSRPEFFPIVLEYEKSKEWIFSEQEERLIASFTGKFRMENHADEIRSRTYTDRLEDHDIFLGELFGKLQPTTLEMVELRKRFGINREYRTGKNVIFIDIGPAIANAYHPAVTSMSLVENFPSMETILMDLPSEVNIFLKKTDPKLRENLLKYENIRILAGDGVLPLKTYFRKEGAWVIPSRGIPQVSGKMIVIRAANSIDVYEPYSRVRPFLESLGEDFKDENLILFFNRLIIAKPKNTNKFQVIGSQSIRGFYHNIQSLDRQGQPPFILSGLALGESR